LAAEVESLTRSCPEVPEGRSREKEKICDTPQAGEVSAEKEVSTIVFSVMTERAVASILEEDEEQGPPGAQHWVLQRTARRAG